MTALNSVLVRFMLEYACVFCCVCEWGNDGSGAAAEVFKGVCVRLSVSVSLI